MNTKEKIRESQREILRSLVKWESSIGRLYGVYSEKLPEMAEFWSKMSAQEQDHARMLESLECKLDEGFLFWNIGKFQKDFILDELMIVDTAMTEAQGPDLTAHDAMTVAIKLESSLLDSKFYSVVKSDAPDFTAMAEVLQQATQNHLRSVQNRLLQKTDA